MLNPLSLCIYICIDRYVQTMSTSEENPPAKVKKNGNGMSGPVINFKIDVGAVDSQLIHIIVTKVFGRDYNFGTKDLVLSSISVSTHSSMQLLEAHCA